MSPPTAMNCSHPNCDFATPSSIPSYDLLLKALELHVNTVHNVRTSTQTQQTKVEKPKRPTVTSSMSESDWVFFTHKWDQYMRQSGISGQQILDELWACLDPDPERLAFQYGMTQTNPDELLEGMNQLSRFVQEYRELHKIASLRKIVQKVVVVSRYLSSKRRAYMLSLPD